MTDNIPQGFTDTAFEETEHLFTDDYHLIPNVIDREELYNKLKDLFGVDMQVGKLHEELGELQESIIDYISNPIDKNLDAMVSEMADVRIMLEQVELFLNLKSKINNQITYKLNRTIDRYEIK